MQATETLTGHSTFVILVKRLFFSQISKSPNQKMSFNGKYERTYCENMEELLEAMEISEGMRRAMLDAHPVMEVTKTHN